MGANRDNKRKQEKEEAGFFIAVEEKAMTQSR
jgi:hypothetical protein